MVFVVAPDVMAAVEQLHGDAATPTVTTSEGLHLFALSGQSTHLGCDVRVVELPSTPDYDGDGNPDGVLIDTCHQGTWDPYVRGRHLLGPGDGPLALLDIELDGARILSTGFDGPIGPGGA